MEGSSFRALSTGCNWLHRLCCFAQPNTKHNGTGPAASVAAVVSQLSHFLSRFSNELQPALLSARFLASDVSYQRISVTMDPLSTSDDDDFQPHTASTGKRRFKTPQRTKGKTPGSISTKKPRSSVQNPERQHTGRIQDTTAPVQTELPTGCRTTGRAAAEQEARAVSTAHATTTTSIPEAAAHEGVQTFSTPSGSGSDEPPAEASRQQLSHSSFLLCPVCAEDLGSISDTDAGRAAHVNACLDAAAAAASAGTAMATSPPADLTTYQEHGEEAPEDQEQDSMQEWYVQYALVC